MAVWKTREELYHGSKWGYAVVALVILIVISLLGSIFYLLGEGIKTLGFSPENLFLYIGIIIAVIIIVFFLGWIFVKIGWMAMSSVAWFFMSIWKTIWALFYNIYILVIAVILIIVLLAALFLAVSADMEVSLASPLTIAILVILLVAFLPFAIFIIDLFSLEEE